MHTVAKISKPKIHKQPCKLKSCIFMYHFQFLMQTTYNKIL